MSPRLNAPQLAAVLLLALLLQDLAWAAPANTYGRYFVRVDRHWPDEAPVVLPIPKADGKVAVDSQRKRLQTLELEQGPYAGALAEPLMDLARYLHEAGDPEQAELLYRRALHVLRVNEGLYSENQLPLLRDLLAVHRSLGDWRALDARYDYFFRLTAASGNMDADSAAEYFRWQREALRRQLDNSDHRRLLRLYEANDQLLAAADPARDPAGYWQLVDSQLRNLYLIQALVRPKVVSTPRGFTPASPFRSEPAQDLDIHEQRLLTVQRTAVAHGDALLSAFVSTAGGQDELLRGQALLARADWHQWNGLRSRAAENYRQVVDHLQAAGQDALLQSWFGSPVELPDNGTFSRDPGEGGVPVVARFAVSATGRPRDVETTAPEERHKGFAMRLYRGLLATRFRPRFEGGSAVATASVERSYRYLDPDTIRRFQSP